MSETDYQYIAKLVNRTRMGDSDAFAELYAATCQKQYRYAVRYLKEEYLAQDALQEAYILVLKNLDNLKDPKLFVPWLDQINFRICFRIQQEQRIYEKKIAQYKKNGPVPDSQQTGEEPSLPAEEQEKLLRQILELPFPQSQTLVMKYYQNLTEDEISQIMEVRRHTVEKYIENGKQKLGQILREN